MQLFKRTSYTNKLLQLMNREEIKIITGVRGAGKSSILKLFMQKLIDSGISKNNVVYIDSYNFNKDFIKALSNNARTYIFIDEVRNISNWQSLIANLMAKFDVDIYVSSSGMSIINDELCTLLKHKPIELEVLPLSFKEYQKFFAGDKVLIDTYLLNGGMPEAVKLGCSLQNIFYSTLAQDVFALNKIADNSIIIALIKILLQEIGNIHSFNSISKLLAETITHVPSVKTVENYIKMLTDSKLFYTVPVFDFKNNCHLTRYAVYYPVDIGFYGIMLDNNKSYNERLLESVIYFELLRSGAKVSTCKVGNKKVSFVAETEDNKIYIHVAKSFKNTTDNIFAPLRSINDHYSKWIITLDDVYAHSDDGIRVINLTDFLLDE